MRTLGSIITEYRKNKGLSQAELAEAINGYGYSLTNKAVSKWEKDAAAPNIPTFITLCKILGIEDIYETFLGYNPFSALSLLNTEGKEKALEYIQLLSESERYQKKVCEVISFRRNIRLFNLPASAGIGEFLDGEHFDMIEIGPEVPAEADFGIRLSGNSMEPRFVNGQIVWVHQQESLQNGEIGIFYLDGKAYCKKLQDDEKGLFLISLNKEYEPIPVRPFNTLKIFGKVVG